MPASLPFTPRASTYTHRQPRLTTTSDFTSFVQQTAIHEPVWAGELLFSPSSGTDDIRAWRAFILELEREGTFWAPIYDRRATTTRWITGNVLSPNAIQVIAGDYVKGDLVQVRSLEEPEISFTKVVESYDGNELNFGTIIPFNSGNRIEVGSGLIHVRAVIQEDDFEQLKVTPNNRTFKSINWIEAMGTLLYGINDLAQSPQLSYLLTESGDILTTEEGLRIALDGH